MFKIEAFQPAAADSKWFAPMQKLSDWHCQFI